MLNIEKLSDNRCYVTFSDAHRINEQIAESLLDQLKECIQGRKMQLILDLGSIHFIDCKGFEALLAVNRLARSNKKPLMLCNVNEDTRELIRIMELNDEFDYVEPANLVKAG